MPYFFVERREGDRVWITGRDARHLAGSLRTRPGEVITVIDAARQELLTIRLLAVGREETAGVIEAAQPHRPEPSTRVTMCIAMLPAAALEEALGRCTELGADRFLVVKAERSVGRGAKPQRWAAICREAAMLAGRIHVPEVAGPVGLAEVKAAAAPLFMLDRAAPASLHAAALPDEFSLGIGPEGGWSAPELEGVESVSLGPRNLRAPNAAATALAVALAARGDL
jgi:16S rRNA (uracil1498-N3)-methyltransferase